MTLAYKIRQAAGLADKRVPGAQQDVAVVEATFSRHLWHADT